MRAVPAAATFSGIHFQLENGEDIEDVDGEGHRVRIARADDSLVLFFDEEPGLKGDAKTLVRLFIAVRVKNHRRVRS